MKYNKHFTDKESYCGPGCTSPHGEKKIVGNQPNISEATSYLESVGNDSVSKGNIKVAQE